MNGTACKYEDPTCDPDWPCEACVFDAAVATGDQGTVDFFARTTGTMARGDRRQVFDGSGTGTGNGGTRPGPTEAQERFIAKLRTQKGYDGPAPATKAEASKLIDRLVALPDVAGADGGEGRWKKVGTEWAVKVSGGTSGATVTVVKGNGDRQEVVLDQDLGDGLWSVQKRAKTQTVTYDPGIYARADGTIVKVQKTKDGERTYGKELDEHGSWNYVPGALRNLTRLTAEEAKAYGHRTGRCCCCGRELTNETSITLGIGPICLAKHF